MVSGNCGPTRPTEQCREKPRSSPEEFRKRGPVDWAAVRHLTRAHALAADMESARLDWVRTVARPCLLGRL